MASLAPVLAFLVTFAMLAWLLRGAYRWLPLDLPNERSLHARPIPRFGGLAIMAGLFAAAMALPDYPAPVFLALLLMGVSLLDDLRGLSVKSRLLVHLAVAGAFLVWAAPGMPLLPRAGLLFGLVWMLNLYNFMDGSDGLAGGMALFGFGFLGLAAGLAGAPPFAWLNASIAATALAFLIFNFHPARIFMGDVGSIPLGFLAGALGFLGWRSGLWSPLFPLLVFSPFLVDATVTLIRRLSRGEKVWRAHRSHYYQRLIQMGWGHRKTALAEYVLMLSTGTTALLGEQAGHLEMVLILWTLLYPALMYSIDREWKKRSAITVL